METKERQGYQEKSYQGQTTNLAAVGFSQKHVYKQKPQFSKRYLLIEVGGLIAIVLFILGAKFIGGPAALVLAVFICIFAGALSVVLGFEEYQNARRNIWRANSGLWLPPNEHQLIRDMPNAINLAFILNDHVRYSFFSIDRRNQNWYRTSSSGFTVKIDETKTQVTIFFNSDLEVVLNPNQPFICVGDVIANNYIAFMVDFNGDLWAIQDPYKHLEDVNKILQNDFGLYLPPNPKLKT